MYKLHSITIIIIIIIIIIVIAVVIVIVIVIVIAIVVVIVIVIFISWLACIWNILLGVAQIWGLKSQSKPWGWDRLDLHLTWSEMQSFLVLDYGRGEWMDRCEPWFNGIPRFYQFIVVLKNGIGFLLQGIKYNYSRKNLRVIFIRWFILPTGWDLRCLMKV